MSPLATVRSPRVVGDQPLSVFDMFRIGIGPSSSHTVGPMRAAKTFVDELLGAGTGLEETAPEVVRVHVELFGSLGATGRGHGTDRAVLLGLVGHEPQSVATPVVEAILDDVHAAGALRLLDQVEVPFDLDHDVEFLPRTVLPFHPNGLRISALAPDGAVLLRRTYFSVGGGFVVPDPEDEAEQQSAGTLPAEETAVLAGAPAVTSPVTLLGTEGSSPAAPWPFTCADDLLAVCSTSGLGVAGVMLANESITRTPERVGTELLDIWHAMDDCIDAGCGATGTLPGGLKVPRRAHALHRALLAEGANDDPLRAMDWVNLYALAVNEENASGHRVVTAPTNGAAGVLPAVLHYFDRFCPGANEQRVFDFLLTSAAIGILYKENASISGAEVGCQGEVGVACSMAAGGLVAALGGNPSQIENAAEIGMEHNLGLTCDPIGGLVQIPCIERNAMGAVKAINASRMAMRGDGKHKVSLDKVIKTMRDTGRDMQDKYKETSRGGLAVNVIEC